MKKESSVVEALCAILVKHHVIPAKEQASILQGFKNSSADYFEEFLIDQGLVDDVNVLKALSEHYQVPATDVVGHFFDQLLLHMFPKDFLLRNSIVPLKVDEDIMVMVASDPSDPELLPRVGEYVSYDVTFHVGLRRHIEDAIKEFYDASLTQEDVDQDIEEKTRQKNEALRIQHGHKTDITDEE